MASGGRSAGELESHIVPVVFIPQPWNGLNVVNSVWSKKWSEFNKAKSSPFFLISLSFHTLFSFLRWCKMTESDTITPSTFCFPAVERRVLTTYAVVCSVKATGHCLPFSFFCVVLAPGKMILEFNFLNRQSLTSHGAVNEQPQQPWREKKCHLMKSVEVRYSSSSRIDEIEPMRDDYIYRWEINFNVQLSSPCEQLDHLDF